MKPDVRFDLVRYANCWEDADVLCEALRPRPGRRVLSIASAGDNAFALAAEGAHVVAADLSRAQLALVELKRAAIRQLDHATLLAFLGLRPCADRLAIFRELDVPDRAAYREDDIRRGVVHAGRFERYFSLFRRFVLPLIHPRRTVERVFRGEPGFYETTWNNRRWRMLFRVFFGRRLQGRLGRDPRFLAYADDVTDQLMRRARRAISDDPGGNLFLEYILRGNFLDNLPRYLRPESFEAVRAGCDRIELVHGAIHEVDGAFDAFNLSDIFEYLSPEQSRALFDSLRARARPGARMAYWNMLVDRRFDDAAPVACEAANRDRGFFYRAFHLVETRSPVPA